MCLTCLSQNGWTGSFHTGADLPSDGQERQYIGETTQGATGSALVDGLISGVRWDGLTITYNFPNAAALYGSVASYGDNAPSSGFAAFTAQMETVTRASFGAISYYTNVTFIELASTTAGASVDIALAQTSATTTGFAYGPSSTQLGGDVWLASGQFNAPALGTYEYLTILHEIGHAMGLKHSHEAGGIAGAVVSARDDMEFSVMSYRSYIGEALGGGYGNEINGFAQTYMMLDIAALQAMYGADYTTNASDSVYTFSATTGEMLINGVSQGDPDGTRIFRTVWDGGGNDTYDTSNYAQNQDVSLAAGSWSLFSTAQRANLGDSNYARANVYNALLVNDDTRALIENAITGDGNDRINGNQVANTLSSGNGNDRLVGQGGNDILNGGAGDDVIYGDFEPGVTPPPPPPPPYTLGTAYTTLASSATNNSAASALNLASNFSFAADADIESATTVAHTTVNATGNGNAGWYKVSLNAGNRLIVDIDNTSSGFDSYVRVLAADGVTELTSNDDGTTLDAGSASGADSQLIYTATTTGFVYVTVNSYSENVQGYSPAIASGATYEINLSIDTSVIAVDPPAQLGVAGNDILNGGAGNDTLTGGSGDDTFIFTAGQDVITDFVAGGTEDRIDLSSFSSATSLSAVLAMTAMVGSNAVITFAAGNTLTLSNVLLASLTSSDFNFSILWNVVTGTPGADNLYGGAAQDDMNGLGGNDILVGLGGNDRLFGGDGADYLYGGDASDYLDGGAGNDVLIGEAGDDTMAGGDGIDYIFSGSGSNVLSGNAGLDILISEGSSDIMNGGADQNYYYRQAAGSSQSFGGDGVDILVGGNFASNDLFMGFGGNDFALGGAGNDELIGGLGDDILLGGDGNDILDGGVGVNYLYADGTGSDTIRINATSGAAQTQLISDFEAGGTNDVFQISGSSLTSFADYQALLANIGTAVNGNLLQNTGVGAILTLNLGTANQTDIWVLGVSAYSLTAGDFVFG